MSEKIILICQVCNARNYRVTRSKTNTTRLTLKKYCPYCKKTTIHQETR